MKRTWFLLAFLLLMISCSKETKLEFRIAESGPGEGLTEITFEPSGEVFYFHDAVRLNQAHVDTAMVIPGDRGSAVDLRLDKEGTRLFEELTRENVGKRCGMFLDGRLVTAPIIRAPISQGRAILSGNFSEEEAERIAAGLSQSKRDE